MIRTMLDRKRHGSDSRRTALVLCSILLLVRVAQVRAASSSDSKCADGTTFSCPNCGGIEVSDCLDCDNYLNTDETNNVCFTRKLFDAGNDSYHFLWNDIVATFVWFCAAGVATACGVGGGGIYVPLGMLLVRFAPKPSSGLSQNSIFGASLGGLLLNMQNKHPNTTIRDEPGKVDENGRAAIEKPDEGRRRRMSTAEKKASEEAYVASGRKFYTRPVIDYDMALFLAPMEMAGAIMGVLIQKLMPNWLYLMISGVILFFTSHKTYKKFFATHRAEKEERLKMALADAEEAEKEREAVETADSDDDDGGDVELQEMEAEDEDKEGGDAEKEAASFEDEGDAPKEQFAEKSSSGGSSDKYLDNGDAEEELSLRRQYLEEDARQYPKEKIVSLGVLWVGLLAITFLKGGKGVESLVGIQCDSPWYGVLIALQFVWTIGYAAFYGRKLVKDKASREKVRYPYLPHDVLWDNKKLRFYASFTFVAGIVAGLIGIGGGMVLGPLMLVMGIHPRVSSATTATMIVLTSSSVAIMFVTSGLIHWSYAVYFFFVCFFGALVGKTKIDGYVKRTGRASLLIFILATIILLATIGCFVIVFTRLADGGWCFAGFNKFCDVGTDEGSCPANRFLGFSEEDTK